MVVHHPFGVKKGTNILFSGVPTTLALIGGFLPLLIHCLNCSLVSGEWNYTQVSSEVTMESKKFFANIQVLLLEVLRYLPMLLFVLVCQKAEDQSCSHLCEAKVFMQDNHDGLKREASIQGHGSDCHMCNSVKHVQIPLKFSSVLSVGSAHWPPSLSMLFLPSLNC